MGEKSRSGLESAVAWVAQQLVDSSIYQSRMHLAGAHPMGDGTLAVTNGHSLLVVTDMPIGVETISEPRTVSAIKDVITSSRQHLSPSKDVNPADLPPPTELIAECPDCIDAPRCDCSWCKGHCHTCENEGRSAVETNWTFAETPFNAVYLGLAKHLIEADPGGADFRSTDDRRDVVVFGGSGWSLFVLPLGSPFKEGNQ